jgi:hypothetical protein
MNKKKLIKPDKKEENLSKVVDAAKKYFESPEFKNAPGEMEKIYNILTPEKLLKRMTI